MKLVDEETQLLDPVSSSSSSLLLSTEEEEEALLSSSSSSSVTKATTTTTEKEKERDGFVGFNLFDFYQLCFVSFLSSVAHTGYVTTTYLYLESMGYKNDAALLSGIVLSVFAAVQGIAGYVVGHSVDRYSCRKVIILTQAIDAIANFGYVFTSDFTTVMICRMISGIASSNGVVAMGYIAVLTNNNTRGKWMGVFATWRILGSALGPLISLLGSTIIHFESGPFVWNEYTSPGWMVGILNLISTIVLFVSFKQNRSFRDLRTKVKEQQQQQIVINSGDSNSSNNNTTSINNNYGSNSNNNSNNFNNDSSVKFCETRKEDYFQLFLFIIFASMTAWLINGSCTTLVSALWSDYWDGGVEQISFTVTIMCVILFISIRSTGWLMARPWWNERWEKKMFFLAYMIGLLGVGLMVDFHSEESVEKYRFLCALGIWNISSAIFSTMLPVVIARVGARSDVGKTMANFQMSMSVGIALAPFCAGLGYDSLGENAVFLCAFGLLSTSFLCFLIMRKKLYLL